MSGAGVKRGLVLNVMHHIASMYHERENRPSICRHVSGKIMVQRAVLKPLRTLGVIDQPVRI